MKIRELHIEQKVLNSKNNKIIEIEAIHASGYIRDTNGNTHDIAYLQPLPETPYLEIDNYGNIMLCMNCAAGKLAADFDKPIDCGYTAGYLSIQPAGTDDRIELASVKHDTKDNNNKDIIIHTWDDPTDESPNHTFLITRDEICEVLEIKEKR